MREDTLKRLPRQQLPRQHVRGIQPHDRTYVAQTLQKHHKKMLPIGSFFFNEHFKFDCRQAVRPFTLQGVTEFVTEHVERAHPGVSPPGVSRIL